MTDPGRSDITRMLRDLELQAPDQRDYATIMPHVLDALRGLASQQLRNERPDHTLQPTALVHEAYLKLMGDQGVAFQDRQHFLAVAARAMRQVLIDHARRASAAKRGGGALKVELSEAFGDAARRDVDLEALDEALTRLEALDSRKCRVVELRFLGGLTMKETAALLDLSPKTIESDWYVARAWLRKELQDT